MYIYANKRIRIYGVTTAAVTKLIFFSFSSRPIFDVERDLRSQKMVKVKTGASAT